VCALLHACVSVAYALLPACTRVACALHHVCMRVFALHRACMSVCALQCACMPVCALLSACMRALLLVEILPPGVSWYLTNLQKLLTFQNLLPDSEVVNSNLGCFSW